MSMFGTPIAQSVAGAAPAERVASRDQRKRQVEERERTRAVADSVEFNAETAAGVSGASAGKNDLGRRPRETYKPLKRTGVATSVAKSPDAAPSEESPRLDVAG